MYSAGHRQIKVVAKKILCDQIIFSPICIVACLIAACVLNGRDKENMYKEVYHKGQELYLAEWLLWPPAQFINFYYLPTKYRVLYDNLVSLVYDTYTSHVKFTVQVTEGLEERLIERGALPTGDHFRTLLDNDY